jgi:5-methyltetrahydrofolate--homocysteine methyltransferase
MVFIAKEMKREGFQIPLLIGGATTSKAHTAVKIAPEYPHGVVHVNDASRAVTVVGDLLQEETSSVYKQKIKEDYEEFAQKFLARTKKKTYVSLADARADKVVLNWDEFQAVEPKEQGIKILDLNLNDLKDFIDWTPFFRSWDLHGKYPAILTDKVVGEQATSLYKDALTTLEELITQKQLQAKAVFGIFEANSNEQDDIELANGKVFRTLRQQLKKREGASYRALSDYIAPKSSNTTDYIGTFCVSVFGADELANQHQLNHDDYNSIMVKAIADRFAEAAAEYLHKEVRTNYWGYAKDEVLSNDELIGEQYKGIRPAPGYPACPDHLEKETIWDLLDVENNIGVTLTESLAMWPAASVSGYYFAHPEAKYFGVGKITKEQLTEYAQRKGITIEKAEKWLTPNLANE